MAKEYPKKLIEVSLPLDDINAACAREKSIRHGHPSTLHLWWARRPLAAARAVIFAQMVNDPGGKRGWQAYKGQTKEDAQKERERLFGILRRLVVWENTTNDEVLEEARAEILKSWEETCKLTGEGDPSKLPAFHDPFAGGGALPMEAQRLGLEAYASDLNPVAVTINKAMIEIPPKFTGRAPVGPIPKGEAATTITTWKGAQGLAEDVRRYGAWMRDEAGKRIGHLYPRVEVTAEMAKDRPDLKTYVGKKLTVIAWLWARTVKSPNPAFSHVEVPLASTFILSSKAGKEAYVEPVVAGDKYHFTVKVGKPTESAKGGTKAEGRGANFYCLLSRTPVSGDYIKSEGQAGRMGARLMAIVAEGERGRVYLFPSTEQEAIARSAQTTWKPSGDVPARLTGGTCVPYGLKEWGDLFTPRQLVALTTFSDLVGEAIAKVREDALAAGMPDDGLGLDAGGTGATAYAQAVGVYLGFAVSKVANIGSSLASWMNDRGAFRETFARQAIPMVWDFAESNPFTGAGGSIDAAIDKGAMSIRDLPKYGYGSALQTDAQSQAISTGKVVSTDPPYYDNIGYADLSDFFYVWLRKSLKPIFPNLYATMAVPKAEELVATPYRHGGKDEAEAFFLDGMTRAMHNLAVQSHSAFPVTIYYAFKQSETKDETGTSNTGWETFLEAVLRAGFAITGTWPMRTEGAGRMIASGTNALASSIVLVCRKRDDDAPTTSRKQFLREFEEAMPEALEEMIGGKEGATPIAPVDLAQAAIGPGMGIFSKYKAVLEADGSPMTIKTALTLINKAVGEYFSHAESDMDSDTRFCVSWFEQFEFKAGPFGEADVLARAKGTCVAGVADAGVLESGGGKVRLLRVKEYPADWDPTSDARTPIWEALHQIIRALDTGESAAGELLSKMPTKAEPIRQLAYHLYTLCERNKWAEDARDYNNVITSWHAIVEESRKAPAKVGQLGFEL